MSIEEILDIYGVTQEMTFRDALERMIVDTHITEEDAKNILDNVAADSPNKGRYNHLAHSKSSDIYHLELFLIVEPAAGKYAYEKGYPVLISV